MYDNVKKVENLMKRAEFLILKCNFKLNTKQLKVHVETLLDCSTSILFQDGSLLLTDIQHNT
jgi:hypothetical protein